jgi:hypothetical protein
MVALTLFASSVLLYSEVATGTGRESAPGPGDLDVGALRIDERIIGPTCYSMAVATAPPSVRVSCPLGETAIVSENAITYMFGTSLGKVTVRCDFATRSVAITARDVTLQAYSDGSMRVMTRFAPTTHVYAGTAMRRNVAACEKDNFRMARALLQQPR